MGEPPFILKQPPWDSGQSIVAVLPPHRSGSYSESSLGLQPLICPRCPREIWSHSETFTSLVCGLGKGRKLHGLPQGKCFCLMCIDCRCCHFLIAVLSGCCSHLADDLLALPELASSPSFYFALAGTGTAASSMFNVFAKTSFELALCPQGMCLAQGLGEWPC